jgi:glutathione synthase/RimK-type ligase-like ATP-grasp enzyme
MVTGAVSPLRSNASNGFRGGVNPKVRAWGGYRESSGVVVMTDHGSQEGSRRSLETAVTLLTGVAPVSIDARYFLTGGPGQVRKGPRGVRLEVAGEGLAVAAQVLIVYEIPPADRWRLEAFARQLPTPGPLSLSADVPAWYNATDKRLAAQCFRRAGIAHMDTIAVSCSDPHAAYQAFARLGGNVWARPATGAGGQDVFHLTTRQQLEAAAQHYATMGQPWLMSRDAANFTPDGRRHQFRVVVLGERVLRVCEHVQADPDAPCNESQGAISTVVPVAQFPVRYQRLAIAATRSVGLAFGGVDLAVEHGGVIFEVNVHPTLDVPGGLESVAIPFVETHLRPITGTEKADECKSPGTAKPGRPHR